MHLQTSFATTAVSLDKSLLEIDRLLGRHGVKEKRYTHLEPENVNAKDDAGRGRILYEFVWPGGGEIWQRRGVRVTVAYRPAQERKAYRGRWIVRGTTAQQAARALYWMLKAKFDSIDWGIEEFEVAFMPHLITQLGSTLAEEPRLLEAALVNPAHLLDVPAHRSLPSPNAPD